MTKSSEKLLLFILSGLLVLTYLVSLGANAVWNPNEAFYADAVSVMFETGDFLQYKFNDEWRFNKPPLTYWTVASGVALFGMNEFGLRLPIALMTLGSIYLTFLMGRRLSDYRTGIFAAVVMAFSMQLAFNSRYATPEIPLTFFFTLTMYLFQRGYQDHHFRYILFSYVSFGLTLLGKGYPYLVIIGAIVMLTLLWDAEFKWKAFFRKLGFLKLYIGLPLVLIIGLGWSVYMYLLHGDAYLSVLGMETVERAFSWREQKGPWLYFIVVAWGFLPYSLAFYAALVNDLIHLRSVKTMSLMISWFGVIFVFFSFAQGKLPAYLLQAHAAMAVITAVYWQKKEPDSPGNQSMMLLVFGLPALLCFLLAAGFIYLMELSPWYYLLFLMLPALQIRNFRMVWQHWAGTWGYLKFLPFLTSLILYLILYSGGYRQVEEFRPFPEIGAVIQQENIPATIPLMVEGRRFHNLSYYAGRKVMIEMTTDEIEQMVSREPVTLALIPEEEVKRFPDADILWNGWLYNKNSELKFFIFFRDAYRARNGNFKDYKRYTLILHKSTSRRNLTSY